MQKQSNNWPGVQYPLKVLIVCTKWQCSSCLSGFIRKAEKAEKSEYLTVKNMQQTYKNRKLNKFRLLAVGPVSLLNKKGAFKGD